MTKKRKQIMIDIYGPEEAENLINIPAIMRQKKDGGFDTDLEAIREIEMANSSLLK